MSAPIWGAGWGGAWGGSAIHCPPPPPTHLRQGDGVGEPRLLVVRHVLQLKGHLAPRRDPAHDGVLKGEDAQARVLDRRDADGPPGDGLVGGGGLGRLAPGGEVARKVCRQRRPARRADVLCKAGKGCTVARRGGWVGGAETPPVSGAGPGVGSTDPGTGPLPLDPATRDRRHSQRMNAAPTTARRSVRA